MNGHELSLHSIFHIGVSIHHLNKKTEKQIGLSIAQWCLLRQLVDMPGVSAFSLAKAAGIHPSTLTQTLKRLERKGFLFITEDPKDSRKKLISLTRPGRNAMESAGDRMKKWSAELSDMGGELQRVLSRLQTQANQEL